MLTLPDRVLERISPCPITGCWFYAGQWNSGNNYGKISYEGETWMFHRLVFTLLKGPIPEGLILDHTCRVRWCCNPEHLEPVTVLVNTLRGEAVLFTMETHDAGPCGGTALCGGHNTGERRGGPGGPYTEVDRWEEQGVPQELFRAQRVAGQRGT